MLEELIKYNKLGSKKEINVLLFYILSDNEYKNINDVRKLYIDFSYTFAGSFEGIIELLKSLEFVEIKGNKIKKSNIDFESEINLFPNSIFFQKLFDLLIANDIMDLLFNSSNTKYDYANFIYYVNEHQISFKIQTIKKLLLATEFLRKDERFINALIINQRFNDLFSNYIRLHLQPKQSKRKITLEELRLKQLENIKHGDEAEEFVLQFEINRLLNHPNKSCIKIISSEFCNAGYDIESYCSSLSIVVDRFIEVKSYSKNISFFWSNNEIEIAKKLGDSYFLYLVNRDKINENNYMPQIIQNPQKEIFENSNWEKNPDSFHISFSI